MSRTGMLTRSFIGASIMRHWPAMQHSLHLRLVASGGSGAETRRQGMGSSRADDAGNRLAIVERGSVSVVWHLHRERALQARQLEPECLARDHHPQRDRFSNWDLQNSGHKT